MPRRRHSDADTDDRPPICPACGVTQGIVVDAERSRFVCLECGFSDDAAVEPRGERGEWRS
jgi:transcription initiation factor TFIIIB Brf1 subunit/transcription initiation factor TFIIB